MTGFRPPSYTVDGLAQRLRDIERSVADLHRLGGGNGGGSGGLGSSEPEADLPSFTARGATTLSGTHLDGSVNLTVASYFGSDLNFPIGTQDVAEVSTFNGKTIDVLVGGLYLLGVQGYWVTPTTNCGLWVDGPLGHHAATAPAYTLNGTSRAGATISALVPLYKGGSVDVYALGGDCASGNMAVQVDLTLIRATTQWD